MYIPSWLHIYLVAVMCSNVQFQLLVVRSHVRVYWVLTASSFAGHTQNYIRGQPFCSCTPLFCSHQNRYSIQPSIFVLELNLSSMLPGMAYPPTSSQPQSIGFSAFSLFSVLHLQVHPQAVKLCSIRGWWKLFRINKHGTFGYLFDKLAHT